jgi:hypothetical protein
MPAISCRPAAAALLVAMLGALALPAAAQGAGDFNFSRDCSDWLDKKGYSADYIEQKTGKRQQGFPKDWRGNVEPRDVQPGDVVISYIVRKGASMRVAYVDEVRRNADGSAGAVFVSEWNWGKYTDERCFVTDHFGRLSNGPPILVEAIGKVWRPSLPLPGAAH